MDLHLERMLKMQGQMEVPAAARVLEINPKHALIKQLASTAESDGADSVRDAALLLLDQARILEGETLSDPAAFARRMSSVMQKSLSA